MHDDMQYDTTQGQGQGHKSLKVGNSVIFKGYCARGYLFPIYNGGRQMTMDS